MPICTGSICQNIAASCWASRPSCCGGKKKPSKTPEREKLKNAIKTTNGFLEYFRQNKKNSTGQLEKERIVSYSKPKRNDIQTFFQLSVMHCIPKEKINDQQANEIFSLLDDAIFLSEQNIPRVIRLITGINGDDFDYNFFISQLKNINNPQNRPNIGFQNFQQRFPDTPLNPENHIKMDRLKDSKGEKLRHLRGLPNDPQKFTMTFGTTDSRLKFPHDIDNTDAYIADFIKTMIQHKGFDQLSAAEVEAMLKMLGVTIEYNCDITEQQKKAAFGTKLDPTAFTESELESFAEITVRITGNSTGGDPDFFEKLFNILNPAPPPAPAGTPATAGTQVPAASADPAASAASAASADTAASAASAGTPATAATQVPAASAAPTATQVPAASADPAGTPVVIETNSLEYVKEILTLFSSVEIDEKFPISRFELNTQSNTDLLKDKLEIVEEHSAHFNRSPFDLTVSWGGKTPANFFTSSVTVEDLLTRISDRTNKFFNFDEHATNDSVILSFGDSDIIKKLGESLQSLSDSDDPIEHLKKSGVDEAILEGLRPLSTDELKSFIDGFNIQTSERSKDWNGFFGSGTAQSEWITASVLGMPRVMKTVPSGLSAYVEGGKALLDVRSTTHFRVDMRKMKIEGKLDEPKDVGILHAVATPIRKGRDNAGSMSLLILNLCEAMRLTGETKITVPGLPGSGVFQNDPTLSLVCLIIAANAADKQLNLYGVNQETIKKAENLLEGCQDGTIIEIIRHVLVKKARENRAPSDQNAQVDATGNVGRVISRTV